MKEEKLSEAKKVVLTAILTALCVVFPLLFHAIPNAGKIFSPMHLPVFIAGLTLPWQYGLLCGILGPVLSAMITGMPNAASLGPMIIELASYGAFAGLFMAVIKTGKDYLDLYISLLLSMVLGRVVAGVTRALIFAKGSYTMNVFLTSYFVTCWPAIVMQLLLVPSVVKALEKSKLIPERYQKKKKEKPEE